MLCSAMGGSIKFEDALEMRLAIMKTSHQNIQDFLAAHPPRISKGDIAMHSITAPSSLMHQTELMHGLHAHESKWNSRQQTCSDKLY